MGVGLSEHRARIGRYYDTALKCSAGMPFINWDNIHSCLLIIFGGKDAISLSLFAFIIVKYRNQITTAESPFTYSKTPILLLSTCISLRKLISESLIHILLLAIGLLLIICGDVHPNPGPQNLETKTISIVHNNICSLQNKVPYVEAELTRFDIITLSETWLYESFPSDKLNITGYHPPIRLDRVDQSAHGGVAVYVREHLYCKHRPDLHVPGLEALWIEVSINSEIMLIGCFYRSPSELVSYYDLIDESIRLALQTPHKVIVLGDFNSDCKDFLHRHIQRIMTLNGLQQMITEPTRYDGDSVKLIDLILTPCPEIIENVGVLPPVKSDHCCVYLEIKSSRPVSFSFKRTLYIYSKLNEQEFLNKAGSIDWNELVSTGTIDNAAELFSERLLYIGKACMPVKTIVIKDKDAPWITEEIKKFIRKKETIYILAKKLNSVWCWNLFKQIRNQLVDKIRNRKEEYERHLENRINSQTNFGQKDWWKLVNSFFNRQNALSSEIPPIKDADSGEIIYSPDKKAELFNSFFVNQSRINNMDDDLPNIQHNDIAAPELIITTEMVRRIINNLDQSKAVGPDLIHNKLLTKAVNIISGPLATLFNRSLEESKFPLMWKTGHVTPIHKKSDRSLCTNYRPISLLSCVGKIMEKCVQKHLFDFLVGNNLLTVSQSGFIPGDSTTYQLLSIYNDFCKSLDQQCTTQALFFDISKAFDRVWHRGLIHKLDAIGIRGSLLNWFTDYLRGRKQAVVIKGKTSTYKTVTSGVPQGSVLGPTLFLIYINDINNGIQSEVKLFADDTSMYLRMNDGLRRSAILNSDVNKILTWSHLWKVDFNPSKTELLTLSNQRQPDTHPILFENTILLESHTHKHLGVVLQNDCRWKSHIESIIAKIRPQIACLRSFKHKFNRKTLEIMYKAYILPHVDYADVVWDNCSIALSNDLENAHLDALRTITGLVRGTSHNKLYSESGFIPLKLRRERHKLTLFFKIVHRLIPTYLSANLPPLVIDINPYHRRRILERQVPNFRTELYRNSFFPSTTVLWNNLPDNIKNIASLSHFKRCLSTNDNQVPPYYYIGCRKAQAIHCRLRLNMSDLHNDMFNRFISEDRSCECGYEEETAYHYLLNCPKYDVARANTINVLPPLATNINTLLFGDQQLSLPFNSYIFLTVQEFITISERFE